MQGEHTVDRRRGHRDLVRIFVSYWILDQLTTDQMLRVVLRQCVVLPSCSRGFAGKVSSRQQRKLDKEKQQKTDQAQITELGLFDSSTRELPHTK